MTGGPNDLYLAPHGTPRWPAGPDRVFEPVGRLDGATTMMDIVTAMGAVRFAGVVTSTYGQGRVITRRPPSRVSTTHPGVGAGPVSAKPGRYSRRRAAAL